MFSPEIEKAIANGYRNLDVIDRMLSTMMRVEGEGLERPMILPQMKRLLVEARQEFDQAFALLRKKAHD